MGRSRAVLRNALRPADARYNRVPGVRDGAGKVGIEITFHDLRHTGQTLAAATGATLADLKKRLGHVSAAAALRYMHTVEGADQELAQRLSKLADGADAQLPTTIVMKH